MVYKDNIPILGKGYRKRGGTNPGNPGIRPRPPVPIPKPGSTPVPDPIPNFPPPNAINCVVSSRKTSRRSSKSNMNQHRSLKLKKLQGNN